IHRKILLYLKADRNSRQSFGIKPTFNLFNRLKSSNKWFGFCTSGIRPRKSTGHCARSGFELLHVPDWAEGMADMHRRHQFWFDPEKANGSETKVMKIRRLTKTV